MGVTTAGAHPGGFMRMDHTASDSINTASLPQTERLAFVERLRQAARALSGQQHASQLELIRTLNEVADVVSSAMSVEDVLETIVERAKSITDTDKAVLVLIDEHSEKIDTDTMVVRGVRSQHMQEWWESRLESLGDRAFASAEPVIEAHPEQQATMLATPLLIKGRPVGLLCAINTVERPFTQEHLDFAQILASFAASAIENARLAEQSRYVMLASERDRIAREMHDGVVQSLFSVSLGLELCKKQARRDPVAVEVRLDELQQQLNNSMSELRRFIYDLRPMKLTELGLVGATEYWISEITKGGTVKGRLVVDGEIPRVGPAMEACLYRVAKEAVSNVVRHAGASMFEVRLQTADGRVRLSIVDDGIGFDSALVMRGDTAGIGLRSISDRVERDGGVLSVESSAGKGTVLKVEIPVEGAA